MLFPYKLKWFPVQSDWLINSLGCKKFITSRDLTFNSPGLCIASMRLWILLSCFFVLAMGCQRSALNAPPGLEHDPVWTGEDGTSVENNDNTESGSPTIIPVVNAPIGQVTSVNEALRFVILDFPLHPMPQVDRRLFIYRDQQKVGVVKVTGPSHGRSIAADLLQGEAQSGDQVRPE